MSSVDLTNGSSPNVPPDSPGSSVSSTLQNEYEELLKYAVVVPKYDPSRTDKTLADVRSSFPQYRKDEPKPASHYRLERQSPDDGLAVSVHHDDDDHEVEPEISPLPPSRGPVESPAPRDDHLIQNNNQQYSTPVADKFGQRQFYNDSPATPVSEHSIDESEAAYSPSVDPDIVRVEHIIDVSSGELKRNLLAELSKAKIKVIEENKLKIQKEKDRHAVEVNSLQNESEGLKELLHTYEQSIERKDEVISNLTRGLQQQREKLEMSRAFAEWRIKHIDHQRQEFSSRLALRHYRRRLAQKVWENWRKIIENKWKDRVEKACQSKAQEVCIALTNDYEARISSLEDALASAREEVGRLHREREGYEETMKKAFMRGVCALNLEAMNMFHEGEGQGGGGGGLPPGPHQDPDGPRVVSQEPVYSSNSIQPSMSRVVTSLSAGGRSTATVSDSRPLSQKTKSVASKPRVLTAKVSAKTDAPRVGQASKSGHVPMGLNPPMSSVLVERHHPITKQTIGQAVASRHPRQSDLSLDRKTLKVPSSNPTVRIVH